MKIFNIKERVKDADRKVVDRLSKGKHNAFNRFPLLFTMLAAFGLVITNTGIQGIIKEFPWLLDKPVVTLAIGLLILLFTGTLYKKL